MDALLDEPFANWHVDTTTQPHQLRVTKPHQAVVHSKDRAEPVEAERGHDRDKERLLPADDPLFRALGLADGEGRIKPSRQAKVRQVEEFLRLLDAAITAARRARDTCAGRLPRTRCGSSTSAAATPT